VLDIDQITPDLIQAEGETLGLVSENHNLLE
jgi:hypothetical protein